MKIKTTHILVPVDFSPNSEIAFKYAIGFAKKHDARITLLHVITGDTVFHVLPMDQKSNRFDDEKKRTLAMMEVWCRKILRSNKIPVKCICVHGNAKDIILARINKLKPHITLMGTKGSGFAGTKYFGSNSAYILEHSELPVMTIPEKTKWHIPSKITLATDYNQSDFRLLKKIYSLFGKMNVHISLLHVADYDLQKMIEKADMEKIISEVLKKTGFKKVTGFIGYDTNIEKGIKNYLRTSDADLLIINKRKRNFLERFLQKSASDNLVFFSKIPLLVFHSSPGMKTV